jgi:predicted TIM-barrel fold metal-dependent hydrolase
MDDIGIDLACISGVGSNLANDRMLRAVEKFPDRFVGFALFNPRYPDSVSEFRDVLSHPNVRGIGEIHPTSYQHKYAIDGPLYEPMWEMAAELSVPVLVHSGPSSERDVCSPTMIGRMANRYDCPVLLGHCGAYGAYPWPMLQEAIVVALREENVYLDLCGTARHFGMVEAVTAAVGEHRVTFGSDASFHSWEPEVAHVVCADLPLSAKEAILGLNAARLLGLEVKPR